MVKKLHSHTSQMLLNSTIDHEQVEAGAGDHPAASKAMFLRSEYLSLEVGLDLPTDTGSGCHHSGPPHPPVF